ncbi:response regulator transcription factor [Ramlibacter humi]|uniref:Response regulator transcription factor n=1 Tax=Ramlibacter humi TaxID=2530451 RepID=A0A4Z0BLT2_9BURK|nr:response regulator transcription factor [Ramlibacter humi]TFZ00287.1 response regulator transcription factor [Ramlibacter humi]
MSSSGNAALRAPVQPCKILVASEHGIIRQGLRLMLGAATSHVLVDDARPMREIREAIASLRPDVVVADVSTGPEGVSALAQVFADRPPPARLLLLYPPCTTPGTGMFSMLRGYAAVSASNDPMELLGALQALLCDEVRTGVDPGETVPDSMVVEGVRITPREREVMQLITQGLCNKRIARALNISLATVRTHRQRLMSKLGLRNSVEVALFGARAFRNGQAEPGPRQPVRRPPAKPAKCAASEAT